VSDDKRFVAWKGHHKKRKAAKAKVKLYEEGKIPHAKLNALAKEFLGRKRRFDAKSA
jgi:hypothetical protein